MGYSVRSVGIPRDWIPTITGFTTAPSYNFARYVVDGKMCTCWFSMAAATSNSTAFTITLPFTAKNASSHSCSLAVDNGSGVATQGYMTLAAGSNIATLFKSPQSGAGAWTASNGKAVRFEITYEIE